MNARFTPDHSQLVGTITCGARSAVVTFERLKDSAAPFSGDWTEHEFGTTLFHIRYLRPGTEDEIAANLDTIRSDHAALGLLFEATMAGAGLQLFRQGLGPSAFIVASANGDEMAGEWLGKQPAGNVFRRLVPAGHHRSDRWNGSANVK